jgi:hypothetical protein
VELRYIIFYGQRIAAVKKINHEDQGTGEGVMNLGSCKMTAFEADFKID